MEPSSDNMILLEAFEACVAGFLVIVAFHLMGLHVAAGLFRSRFHVRDIARLRFHQTILLVLAVMTILFSLHLMTNFAWGLFIFIAGVLPNFRDSVFYSLENYTALGLTRVNVDQHWRMLAPMISLSGVFCLGWSTALLVSFFGRLYALDPGKD